MAGCYGNHPFDRAMEYQLNQYLDNLDVISCINCEYLSNNENEWVYIEEEDYVLCPKCGKKNAV